MAERPSFEVAHELSEALAKASNTPLFDLPASHNLGEPVVKALVGLRMFPPNVHGAGIERLLRDGLLPLGSVEEWPTTSFVIVRGVHRGAQLPREFVTSRGIYIAQPPRFDPTGERGMLLKSALVAKVPLGKITPEIPQRFNPSEIFFDALSDAAITASLPPQA